MDGMPRQRAATAATYGDRPETPDRVARLDTAVAVAAKTAKGAHTARTLLSEPQLSRA